MKSGFTNYLKISFLLVKVAFLAIVLSAFFNLKAIAEKKNKKIDKASNLSSHSFRPLLIQGKKRVIQKTKDMKVESGNIIESELFFINMDFKKRIFEDEVVK